MSKPLVHLDCEVFGNWFAVGLRDHQSGSTRFIELDEGHPFDAVTMRRILKTSRVVTFNGTNFDIPLIAMAMAGKSSREIKKASDLIIVRGLPGWKAAQQFSVKVPPADHVDLIEIAPGKASLKIYGGRLHSRSLQDLPIEPDAELTDEDKALLRTYCEIDLENTELLYRELLPQIELREKLTEEYDEDLKSKSDAQIAETVISHELAKLRGRPARKPEVPDSFSFHYQPPVWVGFETDELKEMFDRVISTPFQVTPAGKVLLPAELKAGVRIGQGVYRMGIGGLHSSESSTAVVPREDQLLVDRDVASYYPSIILNEGFYPDHLGPDFLRVYRSLVERRLAAKQAGDKVTDATLKIVINGSFGKFGNKYSALYAPQLMIQVTMTGQLALLMLIEHLETHGIQVVSANTDGVVMICRRDQREKLESLVFGWELITGFRTEETEYAALYSRDVNNYIAVKPDGSVKGKGTFAAGGLSKNPQAPICVDAVIARLTTGTPVEQTIRQCKDIRRFISLRKVQGGAMFNGHELGRTVRWYYTADSSKPITYKVNGYKVPRTEGARPVMILPEEIPDDLDYDWYVCEAKEILVDLGAAVVQGSLIAA